jgi:tetratricopeptide (TPR) repeat protein
MKGGARILAYEITVILGSIPFIMFLTWRARLVGLTRRNAFLIALILCGDIMLYPWALRSGWIIAWILSIIILIISGTLWSEIQKAMKKEKVPASKIDLPAANPSSDGRTSQIQVNPFQIVEAAETVEAANPVNAVKMEVIPILMSIDELIDWGFKEKNAENFELAASYFHQALSLDPLPDLAFYLIIDCYWLWNNLGKRNYALTQLQVYIQKYSPQFNTQLREQFNTWMTKEDLHQMVD